ncbi:MAG: ATP-binding protein [Candidatus Omnitrophota bacterium]|jgi:two-component system phosphate regulon sensor histidine kinase PhoR
MKTNIHFKIAIIFIIIIASMLIGVYIYLNDNLRNYTYQRIKSNFIKEAQLSALLLENYQDTNASSYGIDKIADKIGEKLKIRTTVIGFDGIVYGDSDLDRDGLANLENHLHRPEVQDALQNGIGESSRFSTTIKMNMLYIAAPFGKEKPVGIIRLSIPFSEIEFISSRLKRTLMASLIIAFLCAVLISFIISAFITKPIKEISWIAQNVARGDFSKKAIVKSNDEIGDLSQAINYMIEQIRSKINEVTAGRSRFEAVLLSMFEGVMVVDIKGTILLINQSLKDFLNIRDDPTGRKPIEVIRNIEIQEIADNTLKLHEGVESKEISLLVPDEKILSVHASPVIRDKEIDGAVLVFYDITELRRLENIRKDFVANVSHELRTPISNIKGYAETLLDGALDDKKHAKDFISIMHNNADRLEALISDLLELAKIESGKLNLNLKPLTFRLIAERVVSGLAKQASKKSIYISIDIPDDIPKILADENKITQVLLNLIDNAVKYTPEKGAISVTSKEKNKFVQVNVSDTGVGIAEEHQKRIFERFYRVDKARSQDPGGTGLGLSIVKHIIQAHGGEVSVQSMAGAGSAFTFTIPKA